MSEQDRAKPWYKLLKEQYAPPSRPGAGDNPARGRSGVDWSDPKVIDAVMTIVRGWYEEQGEAITWQSLDSELCRDLSLFIRCWERQHKLNWRRQSERTTDPPRDPPTAAPEATERAPEGGDRSDGSGESPGFGDGGYGEPGGFGGPPSGG